MANLDAIQSALESSDVKFMGLSDGRPGVRLSNPREEWSDCIT